MQSMNIYYIGRVCSEKNVGMHHYHQAIISYLKMNLTDDKFIWVYIFSKQNVLYKNAPSWVVEKYGYLGNRREGEPQ